MDRKGREGRRARALGTGLALVALTVAAALARAPSYGIRTIA